MTSTNMTNFDPALKQLYRRKKVEDLTYEDRPMLALLPKFEGFGGRNMPIVLKYGNPVGASATFADTQGNETQLRVEDFVLTRVNQYNIALIDGETAEATEGDNYAFMSALEGTIDGAMMGLSDKLETFIPRSGTGTIGQVSTGSTVGSSTITLADIHDVVNFEVGMTLVGTSTDGGAEDTGEEVLAGVNREDGVLTATSVAWNTVMTALATSDFLTVDGDAAAGGANKCLSGFEAWCPATAPGTTAFFGVDRSVDTRLGGLRTSQTGGGVEEALVNGCSIAEREGGKIDTVFINHVRYRELVNELGSKAQYDDRQGKSVDGKDIARIGFRGVKLDGGGGQATVIAANKCQSTVGWALCMKYWVLATLGRATKFAGTKDGNRILRQSSADGYEVRMVSRGNIGCSAPGKNIRITLPS